jgi:hypothetical protein
MHVQHSTLLRTGQSFDLFGTHKMPTMGLTPQLHAPALQPAERRHAVPGTSVDAQEQVPAGCGLGRAAPAVPGARRHGRSALGFAPRLDARRRLCAARRRSGGQRRRAARARPCPPSRRRGLHIPRQESPLAIARAHGKARTLQHRLRSRRTKCMPGAHKHLLPRTREGG